MDTIRITSGDQEVEISRKSWEIMMNAVDYLVSSGDAFMLLNDQFTMDEIAEAQEDRGAICLEFRLPPESPALTEPQPEPQSQPGHTEES